MFCTKCGKELPDGSAFCTSCGASLDNGSTSEPAANAVQENPAPVQPTVPAPVQYTEQGDPAPAPAAAGNAPAAILSGIKNIPVKFIAIGAGILVAVIVAIIVIIAAASSSKPGNAYVYLSDRTFNLITNINSDDFVEIDSVRYSYTYDNLVTFSEDGKYIYYFSKMDDYGDTGTLCRAEYGRLSGNPSQNEKYIETIAKNVRLGFRQANGGLLYFNDSGALYYYDGSEPHKIANSVSNYATDDKGRLIYLSESALYAVYLNDADNKNKLVSGIYSVLAMSDFDNILFTKSNDNGTTDIYAVGFDKESEKVVEDVYNVVYRGDGVVYYTTDSGKTAKPYDYIVDDYASADAGITQPDINDYQIPNYRYESLSSYSNLSNYDEICLSLTDDVYFYRYRYNEYEDMYYDYYWYYRYYNDDPDYADAMGMTNLDKWAAIEDFYEDFNYTYSLEYAAEHDPLFASEYKTFVDKYKSQADENGYISVTDAMKQELNKLANTVCNYSQLFKGNTYTAPDSDENAWMYFCYGKYQSGSTTDEKYYDELEKYNAVANRIQLRNELQSEYYKQMLYTLYRYENGAAAVVSENVLSCKELNGAITYNTTDSISKTVNINDLYWASDALSVFSYNYENDNPFVLTSSGKQVHMSDSALEDYYEICYQNSGSVCFTEGCVYLYSNHDGLYAANISNDTIESFEFIVDEAYVTYIDKETNTVYYFSDIDGEYAALYSCSGKETKTLAKDILSGTGYFRMYEDGVITAYSDRYGYSFELSIIDAGGSKTIIDDEVTYYIRVDSSNLLYISDGDLYHFDGSKKTRLATDVTKVWSLNAMEVVVG